MLRLDAPRLFDGLTGRGLPVYIAARLASALAVAAIVTGWAAGQYPYLLPPSLTVEQAATGRSTLLALLVALSVGAVVLIPALTYLYLLFQRPEQRERDRPDT